MHSETYTPGYSSGCSIHGRTRAEIHGGFFLPRLRAGWQVLGRLRARHNHYGPGARGIALDV
jgi:hypothetical protein